MGRILIIDDDPLIREVLAENIAELGHAPLAAGTLAEGFRILDDNGADLVFLDIRLPDGDGLARLPDVRRHRSAPNVIIVTGVGDADSAEMAIRSGAWDYLQKPLARKKIHLQIERVFEYRNKTTGNRIVSLKRDEIVGDGPAMKECLDRVAQCAHSRTNVLISGETGTGKDLFARAIHGNSDRAERDFVAVDCASLTENLAESILFGHERGAFTGADRKRAGLLAQAHGGTLFLDEVGELPPSVQKTFLRVLQERRYRPVGASAERAIDFRLVSATHRDLEEMTTAGDFRLDLLFRLRTFEIRLPPLRERPEDLQLLALHYLLRICKTHGFKIKGPLPEFAEHLEAWHWPGNVRELVNTLEFAALSDPENPMLFPMHLPPAIRAHFLRRRLGEIEAEIASASEKNEAFSPEGAPLPQALAELPSTLERMPPMKSWRDAWLEAGEKAYLQRLTALTDGDIPTACRISGLSQSRMYHYLKKYGIGKISEDS